MDVLHYGTDAEIVEPQSLREQAKSLLQLALSNYEGNRDRFPPLEKGQGRFALRAACIRSKSKSPSMPLFIRGGR